jgi:hypothetical protein
MPGTQRDFTAIRTTFGALRAAVSISGTEVLGGLKLLDAGHGFSWLGSDATQLAGFRVVVLVGGDLSTAAFRYTLAPGGLVPIKPDQSVFLFVTSLGAPATGASADLSAELDSLQVAFFAMSHERALVYVPAPYTPGALAFRTAWHGDVSAAGATTIVQASDIPHVAGLPLSLRVSLAGGQFQSTTDFPCELILYEYDDDGSPVGHPRIWLFPGDAQFLMTTQVARQDYHDSADASRWRLVVSNPTGGQDKTNLSVLVEAIVGALPEQHYTRYAHKDTPSSAVKDTVYTSAAFVCNTNQTTNSRIHINNIAGTASFRLRSSQYWPEDLGGPVIDTLANTDTAAGGSTRGNVLIDGPWYLLRGFWITSNPTGTTSFEVTALPAGGQR